MSRKSHADFVFQHYTKVLSSLHDPEERVCAAISAYEYILQAWPTLKLPKESLLSGMSEIEIELQTFHTVSLSKKMRLLLAFQTIRSLV